HRTVSCVHIKWGTQPDQVLRLSLNQRVNTVQRLVRWNAASAEDVNQTTGLEQCGTSLGVTSQGLLRDDEQWLVHVAANGRPQDGVQLRLVRVIGVGGGVVLRQHRNIVRGQIMTYQAICDNGVLMTTYRSLIS